MQRRLLFAVVVMLATGTVFYSSVEGWSIPDALYFSVVTLTTVGFGDLAPTRPVSRVFTIVYILVGVGVLTALIRGLVRQATTPDTTEPGSGAVDDPEYRLAVARRLNGEKPFAGDRSRRTEHGQARYRDRNPPAGRGV